MGETPSRKLAVILHADVVGSTKLVQINESIAHERIQATFRRISKTSENYGGTAHEIRGDALVAEFSRASDAVCAALAFQAENTEHNRNLRDDIRPEIRVGISLGEVVVADGTVTGAGVVLAQRLEQLAEPRGVVVQGSVAETVPTRLPFVFECVGECALKGFDQPVRAFAVRQKPGAATPGPEFKIANAGLEDVATDAVEERPSLEFSDQPSIAVLPFTNMSGDPEQEYFADGIAEDVITALSRFRELFVIARSSSFTYRGTAVDSRQVGRDLGVQYALEGSVRRAGDRVRVAVQLIETMTGNHLWVERFDRSLEDVFAIQDEITESVAAAVGRQIDIFEGERAERRDQRDLGAWELTARAEWYMNRMTEEGFAKARTLCLDAIERFPSYAVGHSLLACINILESTHGFGTRSPADSAREAGECAQAAIALDPDDGRARTYLAWVLWMAGRHDAAILAAEAAIHLNPNDSGAVAALGSVHAYSGPSGYARAVELMERAIRLSPNDPFLRSWYAHRGMADFLSRDPDAAIEWFQRSLQRDPGFPTALRLLAAAYAHRGDLDRARATITEHERVVPGLTIAGYRQRIQRLLKRPQDFEYLAEGLRLAGVPEN